MNVRLRDVVIHHSRLPKHWTATSAMFIPNMKEEGRDRFPSSRRTSPPLNWFGGGHMDIEEAPSYGVWDKSALTWLSATGTLLPLGHNLLLCQHFADKLFSTPPTGKSLPKNSFPWPSKAPLEGHCFADILATKRRRTKKHQLSPKGTLASKQGLDNWHKSSNLYLMA